MYELMPIITNISTKLLKQINPIKVLKKAIIFKILAKIEEFKWHKNIPTHMKI
jgi:hypothetical protein